MKDKFRKIPSLKFLYEINGSGVVRNIKSKHVLKQSYDKDGYAVVAFNFSGIQTRKRVSRLVAECWVPNPNNYPVVNHIDENKKNNYYKNLEWCTTAYNNSYGKRLQECRETISKTLNHGYGYYAENDKRFFATCDEAAHFIEQTYNVKGTHRTIMRNIRYGCATHRYYYHNTWKKVLISND